MNATIALFLAGTALAGPSSWTNAAGQHLRRADTGHVTNYDEAKVGAYTLPDPLVLADGRPVRDAATWYRRRRPELLELYRRYIYGRVPADAPRPTFSVAESEAACGGMALRQVVVLRFGTGPRAVRLPVTVYLPARADRPVPLILQLTFFGEHPPRRRRPPRPDSAWFYPELAPIRDVLARGYGYAFFTYTDVQPDSARTAALGVEALAAPRGGPRPPDGWGTISAWAWAASRVLDYFETDPAVDARRVALVGHSRLGKTVLWAGAQDPRFALVFSSCAGEMGSSLARRDYGETVDDMAENFPWQFAPNFQQFAGHWDRLPVDTHLIIALNAPHPVFITGGTGDQWSDPRGEFLAEVAAAPVYRLLGLPGIGTDAMPGPDQATLTGDLAFRYHAGPHAIMPGDWAAFFAYAARYLHPVPPGAGAQTSPSPARAPSME